MSSSGTIEIDRSQLRPMSEPPEESCCVMAFWDGGGHTIDWWAEDGAWWDVCSVVDPDDYLGWLDIRLKGVGDDT